MALKTQELRIDFKDYDFSILASAVQGEKNSRPYKVTFYDGEEKFVLDSSKHVLKLSMETPNGNMLLKNVDIESDGTATLLFDETMTVSAGIAGMQFVIQDKTDDTWIRSFKFRVKIGEAVNLYNSDTPSVNPFILIIELIEKVEKIAETLEKENHVIFSATEPEYEYSKANDEWMVEY